jgi:hypothetical protein
MVAEVGQVRAEEMVLEPELEVVAEQVRELEVETVVATGVVLVIR